jgi:hypothetical protein
VSCTAFGRIAHLTQKGIVTQPGPQLQMLGEFTAKKLENAWDMGTCDPQHICLEAKPKSIDVKLD